MASKQKGTVSHGRMRTTSTKLSYTELLAITNVFSIAGKGLHKHCKTPLMFEHK